MAAATVLEVQRDDLRRLRWAESPSAVDGLAERQVAVRVGRFALTANNITYAVLGDRLKYWQFFPASGAWGRIPAWGIGEVVASRHPDLPTGERLFGYLPMGSEVVLHPGRVGKAHFAEGSPHRAELNPAYNHYVRLPAANAADDARDNALCLLRPLVMTGLVAEAFFQDRGVFGAKRVILASASSKTALATAFLLRRGQPHRPTLIGLTSASNVDFCRRTGCYDEVFAYPEVPSLLQGIPTALLDMAGNATVRMAVHRQLTQDLVYSGQVGWTHWDQGATSEPLPGIPLTFFSSLEHIRQRNQDWGPAGFEERFRAAWEAFVPAASGWLTIQHGRGRGAVEQAYRALLDGGARPDEGQVLSL